MENPIKTKSKSKRYYHKLQFIPFVTTSKEEINNLKSPNITNSDLNGEEICKFYEEVISSPSSVTISASSFSNYVKDKKSFKIKNKRLTIFHYAQNGDIQGIKYCISQGCDVNVTDMYNWTPLMCATFEGHIDIVAYLIKCGANLNMQNKQNLTALDLAVQKKHKTLIKFLKDKKMKETSVSENVFESETKYCDSCNCSYTESVQSHNKSIAHLFSCKKEDISTYYHIPESNKGFQMMLKNGWDKNKGLGSESCGRKFPIKTVLKSDRTCIGKKKEIPKITHFGAKDYNSVKKHNKPPTVMMRERTYKKRELQNLQRKSRQKEIEFRRQFNMDF